MGTNPLLASELSSAITDTFIVYPLLGITIILMKVENPTELDNKVCCERYYKNA